MGKEVIGAILCLMLLSGCKIGCDDAKAQIDSRIAELNYCAEDSDCIAEYFGCPFGCYSYINKAADTAEVKKAAEDYKAKCMQCEYGCIEAPQLACQDGKCVELPKPAEPVPETTTEVSVAATVKECPSCDDVDNCTVDSCSVETGYECRHEKADTCCGNKVCEPGEKACSDCPKCESTKCSTAMYDYDGQKCVVTKISPCCGNGICENTEDCDCSDCTCKEESKTELSGYPDFLKKSPLIVVGDEGTGQDVMTATNLGLALYNEGITVDTKLASQVDSISGHDMVVIGKPCQNKMMRDLLDIDECDILAPDTAMLRLVEKYGNQYVILAGYNGDATEKASDLLINHGKHDLDETQVMVSTSGSLKIID